MGGSAFATGDDPLYTPRMSPHVYHAVKEACHGFLRQVFVYVASPIEGPAKADHGDIDILVALEKQVETPTDASRVHLLSSIQSLLGSERAIIPNGQASANMAIPWPRHLLPDARQDDDRKRYIQVDVRICHSLDQLQWMLFKHAHGDIWNLLGSIIRPFGLTVDEEAMWIRIPDIENLNRNRAKVFLSNDPTEILEFLHLPIDGFWDRPFSSVDTMFEYVARSRFFWIFPKKEATGQAAVDGANELAGVDGGETGKKKLKHNDRRRMAGRPVFKQWIEDFIPQAQASGRHAPSDPNMTVKDMRDLVRRDAFRLYPTTEVVFRRVLDEWIRERQVQEVWNVGIKGALPATLEPQVRGSVASALKKIVLLGDETLGVVPQRPLRTPDGDWLVDEVARFVLGNWHHVLAATNRTNSKRLREHMERKEMKSKAELDSLDDDGTLPAAATKARSDRPENASGETSEYDDTAEVTPQAEKEIDMAMSL